MLNLIRLQTIRRSLDWIKVSNTMSSIAHPYQCVFEKIKNMDGELDGWLHSIRLLEVSHRLHTGLLNSMTALPFQIPIFKPGLKKIEMTMRLSRWGCGGVRSSYTPVSSFNESTCCMKPFL